MTDMRLFKIACWLRPELRTLDAQRQLAAMRQMTPFLLTAPFALIGVVALTLSTDWARIGEHALTGVLLIVAILILSSQPFQLRVRLSNDNQIPVSSSLDTLVIWGGMFIVGPNALWAPVIAMTIQAIRLGWQRWRLKENPIWLPLSLFSQDLMNYTLVYLLALTVYEALGGVYPLDKLSPELTFAAISAILVGAILPALLLLPTFHYIHRLTGSSITFASLRSFIAGIILLTLVSAPFALLLSVAFDTGSYALFLYFLVGIVLVNGLAHYLSQANDRSQQRSHELAHLEDLGEAIIQAPSDCSTLPELLRQHLPRIFAQDYVEVRIFEPDATDATDAWRRTGFHLRCPEHHPSADDAIWEKLPYADTTYFIQRKVVQPGARAATGDAIVSKIMLTGVSADENTPTCVGGIYLLRNKQNGRIDDALPVVQTLASQIGAALYQARVHAETLAFQKVEQELALAGRIQASFLPSSAPALPGWDIIAALEPARQTSGDFYDFINLGPDRLGLVVADVADKGTGAALFMALSRTLLRTFAMQCPDQPAQALALANARILSDTDSEQFVTVFYGILNAQTGQLTYANAGHNPPYLFSTRAAGVTHELNNTGMPLGLFEEARWKEATIKLEPSDILLLYSDGLTDAQDDARDFFGSERVKSVLQTSADGSAEHVHCAMLAAVKGFMGSAPQFDDITLMVVRRNS